jgi:tRNA(fMet)-specific endonuclease VapC
MKYLLDTTWIVEYLRGNAEVISRVQELQEEGLAVSIISVAELYEGVFRSNNPTANEQSLKDLLSAATVLEITQEICRVYGEEKAKLVQKGAIIGALDLLIAATVLHHNLTLLTEDHDFERIEGLNPIFLQN